jgi:flagellar biosynthetic protein FliR
MSGDRAITEILLSFLLALARLGGIFSFVPIPGVRNAPELARAFLAAAFTLTMFPFWPAVDVDQASGGVFVLWMLAECALGVAAGLAVAFVCDTLVFCMHMAGFQAGFSFASTVDPTTQADSTVLLVAGQLAAGLLFFASGFDREIIRAMAVSLHHIPQFPAPAEGWAIAKIGAAVFTIGLRLAAPTMALLLMLEVALALASRVNAHLQMLSMAFPVKMAVGLAALALTVPRVPLLFSAHQKQAMAALLRILGS